MSSTFTAARLVQLLRHGTTSALGRLSRRAKDAVKFGTAPWVFASTTGGTSDAGQSALENTAGLQGGVSLDKARLNAQIPVKPVYIAPRNPVVLCHGLYGFDVRGPEKLPILQVHYWRGVREALEKIGAKVVVAKVPGTGGVRERAHQLDSLLESRLASQQVNILGHSMGGLDARYLITHINPKRYSVASLTTVCTPHRGSPFMDWCRDYLSLGYRVDPDQLIRDFASVWKPQGGNPMGDNGTTGGAAMTDVPDAVLRERIDDVIRQAMAHNGGVSTNTSDNGAIDPSDVRLREFAHFLTNLLGENASVGETSQLAHLAQKSAVEGDYLDRSMSLLRMVYRRIMATLDTPAYACLTTDYCKRFFNPATPDVPGVEYFSVGAHMNPDDLADKVNPLIIPHDIINKAEGPNDGFVSLESARWGHIITVVEFIYYSFIIFIIIIIIYSQWKWSGVYDGW
ncbi:hypothetical protein GGI07_002005 [Coemansia sp. Benny D115]|nr:hypothetical protein GGI07_002005 [Coemansia sp. Benny D115]